MLEAKDGKQEIKCLSCMELVFPFHLEIPCIYSMPFTESFLPRGVYCRSWHATAYSPNLAWQPFLCGSRAKNGFYICKSLRGGREGIKRRKIFCNLWKLYNIQISLFINNISLEHSNAHLLIYNYLWLLSPYGDRVSSCFRDGKVHSI